MARTTPSFSLAARSSQTIDNDPWTQVPRGALALVALPLLAHNLAPRADAGRHAAAVLTAALTLMAIAVVGSSALGSWRPVGASR